MRRRSHEPVALELAHRLRQHLLADAADSLLKLGVAAWAFSQRVNDDNRPGVSDQAKRGARWAVRQKHVVLDATQLTERVRKNSPREPPAFPAHTAPIVPAVLALALRLRGVAGRQPPPAPAAA